MKKYLVYFAKHETKWCSKAMNLVPCEPYFQPYCGSDNYYPLDGRKSLRTLEIECTAHAEKTLNRKYFGIVQGSIKNHSLIRKNFIGKVIL